jgi:F0F1-type ATP synthase membrane subunit c/vacuolar-type H+-ATPase subunit K
MLILLASKMIVVASVMITLGGASVGTGILFAGYLNGAARNPEEAENLFNTSLMAFALIETFVFLSFLVAGLVYFLV